MHGAGVAGSGGRLPWDQGHFDVSVLADYLAGLLKDQLAEQATAS
jgi:hypothetical protein